jgi:hypothetical protein
MAEQEGLQGKWTFGLSKTDFRWMKENLRLGF